MLAAPQAARADVLKVGDRLAELDVAVDAAGRPVKLKAYRGRWVVLTVGADWCKPCAKELPTWDKLAGELKGKVTFFAIDIDDEIDVGKRFHDKLKIRNMQRVYLPAEKSGVAGNYGSATMPSTFVADPQGVVRHVQAGFEAGDADGEYRKLKGALAKLVK
ncbi:MAG TPA: TlpA disulfide reductase family protein [Kofleriaceae bacterium]|nr:TlpA disulfide reductase family protein [Kofleriaceae bacterium]